VRPGPLSSFAAGATALLVLAGALVATPAGAASELRATVSFPSALSANVPLARVQFNQPVSAAELPHVTASPKLNVTWQQIGPNSVEAVTTSTLVPDNVYLLSVPTLVKCTTYCFTLRRVLHSVKVSSSELWLQELLAQLNYLPVSFVPAVTPSSPTAFVPGSFTWKFANLPSALRSQWRGGVETVIVTGAIKRFQDVHALATTGLVNGQFWRDLLRDVRVGHVDPNPYDYVYVSQSVPEKLTLYRNNKVIFTSPVNTGISAAPTESGTYPVYSRFESTTMKGTNPDGTTYNDPDIPWVSYFHGGDALHGFLRASYGWPQSLGCVEMPYADARIVYKYTPIGTLVTVS
jgi:peptidoglycan hydrolase-like protein with peptidoglycan-binding domain